MVSCKYCTENASCENKGSPPYQIRKLIIADSFRLCNEEISTQAYEKATHSDMSVEEVMRIVYEVAPVYPYRML